MAIGLLLAGISLLGTALASSGQQGAADAQAAAIEAQAAENRRAAFFNAAELEALNPQIEEKRGKDITTLKRNLTQIVATQRAQAGASGIKVGRGSSKRLKDEAVRLATLDRIEIDIAADRDISKNTRQAEELKRSGVLTSLNATTAAADTRAGGKLQAFGTALSGATSSYNIYKQAS